MGESVYKRMYLTLFHGITDSLEQLEQQNLGSAAALLKKALGDAEEYYLQQGESQTESEESAG